MRNGKMSLHYRKDRVWGLATLCWVATALTWLVAPTYIPFRLIEVDPNGFSGRSWPFAAASALLISLLCLRHVVRMVVHKGTAEADAISIQREERALRFVVQTATGRIKRYSTLITTDDA